MQLDLISFIQRCAQRPFAQRPGPAHLKAMDPMTMQQAMMDQAVSQVLSNVERAVDDELERVENITARRRHHPRSLFRAPG